MTPAGFRHLYYSATLARRDFDATARDLFDWQMHSRAGLQVQASDIPLRLETVVLMRWGLGALSLKIPCRVLEVIDEPAQPSRSALHDPAIPPRPGSAVGNVRNCR